MIRALYVDVDGTLVGPGGDALWGESTRMFDAILRCRRAGLSVVPVTGRGRVQVRELCRFLGMARGIAELGSVHVEGQEVRYELGPFPFPGRTPVEAMEVEGAVALAVRLGLEPHDPWNEGREATFLLRGDVDVSQANAFLAEHGLDWCHLIDNGVLRRRGMRAYHLAPVEVSKAHGVRSDRRHHGLGREEVVYVGDSASDLACADDVSQCWLVANADPALDWQLRTEGSYGDGVAEVVDRLLS